MTSHKNSAKTQLAKLAQRAYAAHWRGARIRHSDGMTPVEVDLTESVAWMAVVEAVMKGME